MAYVLGFFAADGSMLKNKRGAHFIEFSITDRNLLYKIRDILGSSHKISKLNRDPRHNTIYRLQIGSKEFFEDLQMLGFTQGKSLTLSLPEIDPKFFPHFVRGYFDGDGCVYFKKHFIKARQKKRWVFTSRFTCGSRKFLESLHIQLGTYTKGGFIIAKSKESGFELVFSHRGSVALFELMYNNQPTHPYLVRKYRLFKKAIDTLYGSNAAVAQR